MFKPNPYTANLSFSTHIVCSDEQHQLILQQLRILIKLQLGLVWQKYTWELDKSIEQHWQIHTINVVTLANPWNTFDKYFANINLVCKSITDWQNEWVTSQGNNRTWVQKMLHKKFYLVDIYLSSKIIDHIRYFQFRNKSKYTTDPAWHSQKL